jgi:hypothetical protein
MVFRDTRSAWFAVQLGFRGLLCCFCFLVFFFFFFFPLSISSTQFSGQKTFDYRPATTNSFLNTTPSLIHPMALEVCDKVNVILRPAGFVPFH